MNGFYLAIGKQGSGKTVLITKFAVDDYQKEPKQIYSNYTLMNGIPYIPITFDKNVDGKVDKFGNERISILEKLDENPHFFDNSIMLLDEIHIYLDSLDFMRKNNRKMQTFFSQLRKRNIYLLATTQYIMNVDIRIRRQCMNVFEMNHVYKDLFECTTSNIDGYYTEELSTVNMILSEYYPYYDTNEIIIE